MSDTDAPPTIDSVINDLHPDPAPSNAPTPAAPDLHELAQSVLPLPSPDASAQIFNLSKTLGEAPQAIFDNRDQAVKAALAPTREEFDVVGRNFPITAAALANRETMAQAYDDVPNLAAHEQVNKKVKEADGYLESIEAGLQGSILGMTARTGTPDIALGPKATFGMKFASQAAQFAADFPYMAAGGAAGALLAAPAGPIAAGLAGMGGSFALPDAYRTALREHFENGDSDSAADLLMHVLSLNSLKAGAKGFATGVLTGVAGGIAAPAGKIASTAAEIATMTAAPAAMEGKAPKLEDLAQGALLVALTHGVEAAGGYTLDRAFPKRVTDEIRMRVRSDAAARLDETSRASKLRARDPETFEKLLNQHPPILVNREAYESLLQQSGKDPGLFSNDLGVAASHNEARETNGYISIPQGKWLGKEMDEYRPKLADDITFDASQATRNEAKKADEAVGEQMQAVMAASDAAIKAEPARKEAFDAIQQKTEELLTKNGVDPKQVKANAQIVAAHYTAEAVRRGNRESAQTLYDAEFPALSQKMFGTQPALTQGPSYPILSSDGTERAVEAAGPGESGAAPGRGSAGEGAGRSALLETPIRPEARHAESLSGPLPKGFPGPTPEIRQAAEIYARSIGLPDRQPDEYVKADPERGKRIADAFAAMKHEPNDPQVRMAYDALIRETVAQLGVMDKMGVKYEAIPTGKPSPYKNSADMIADVRAGHLWFFPTTEGFGSDAQFNDHPLMAETEAKDVNGKPMLANDVFRVVHDFFGHAKEGNGFGPHGEENAWQSHVRMYSDLAASAMTSETRGQNSWVNFGPFAEVNRANPGTKYADQKAGILPAFVNSEGIAKDRNETLNQDGENAPTFYSKLQKDIEAKLPEKATVEQARALLRDAKEDERKWSGIDDFLDKQKDGKVNKRELLDHLRANQLEIGEVEKGDSELPIQNIQERPDGRFRVFADSERGFTAKIVGSREEAEEWLRERRAEGYQGAAKFSKYQLPGGQNYRELLLTLPNESAMSLYDKQNGMMHDLHAKYGDGWRNKATPEELEIVNGLGNRAENGGTIPFRSSHFDEPNILAHVRFNDRGDADGKRVLFLEEVQSDWHQKGRRQGYTGDKPSETEIDKLPEGYNVVEKEATARHDGGFTVVGPQGMRVSSIHPTAESAQNEFINMFNEDARRVNGQRGSPVPDAPFKKTWHEFALKRMLRYAAENGYDKLGWTTGEQQAERYDLSKQVETIRYYPDSGLLRAYEKGSQGGKTILDEKVTREKLADYIGKEAAQKIDEAKEGFDPNTEPGGSKVKILTNADLKVGGEGMKGFYDKIVPSFLNKFGKKFGAQVEKNVIGVPGYDERGNENEDFESHALPITPELRRAALKEGFPLFQGEGAPRGEYVPALNEIRLGKDADASTYMHEFFHGALAHMFDFVKSGNANQEYLDHFKGISDFLGIKDDQESLTREQQEKGARAFERYLRGEDTQEGATRAPSPELRGAFGLFRRWLTQTYRQIKGSPIEGELTADAHGFFDRMLASEDQIAAATRESGYNPSEIQNLPDADPAIQKRVRTLQERAHDQAVNTLLSEQMAEMRDENKKTLDTERERLTAQVSPQVDDLPVHRAGDDLQDAFGKKQIPADYAKNFLEGKANEHEQAQFEAIAELNGFQDGRDMAQQVVAAWQAGGKDAEIKNRVEAGMQPFADLKDTEAIKARALEVIHSSRSTELLALELQALEDLQHKKEIAGEVTSRRRADAALEAAQVKAQARDLLASKPVGEAGAFRPYFTAEKNAAVRVSQALASEDYEGAAKAKREQMMNHALASEALRNKAEIGRTMKFLNKFGGRGGELLKMPYGFVHQIDDLLASRGLAEPKTENDTTLLKIAQGMQAKGEDPADIANATGFMQGDNGKWRKETLPDFVARVNDNYYALQLPDSVMQRPQADSLQQAARGLTMRDLRDVRDSIKAISGIGKEFESFLNAFIKTDIKSAGLEIADSISKKLGAPRADETKPGHQYDAKWKEFLASLKNRPEAYINDQKTLYTLCDVLDGGDPEGPMKKYVYRPLKMAYDNRDERTITYRNEINDLLARHYTPDELADYKNQKFQFEFSKNSDGSPRTWYKDELLAMGRNWGNEGNRDRVMRGFKLDETQVGSMLENLSKKDWDANQEIFDHLQSYWPDIVKQEMKVQGFEPHQVEPATIHTPYGDYKGGYYPIKYDFEKSIEANRNEMQKNELFKQMSAAAAHTDKGHVQTRVNTLSRPLRLSGDVLVNHIENVNHDLAFRETVIDTNRLLRRPEVREAITSAIGQDGLKTIEDHLRAVASDQGNYVDGAEAALRWFRFKATMATLAVRPFIFPLRLGGDVINAVSEMGVSGTKNAMWGYWTGDGTREAVDAKSVLMKTFSHEFERDVFDVSNSFEGASDLKKTYLKYAFAADTFADQIMRYPMWNKIYQDAIAQHGDETRAVNTADEAITRTFGSGRSLDQIQAQRGSEFQKATTMYMSWSTMMFNRWLRGAGKATSEYYQGNPGAASATLIKAATFTFILPAIYDTLVREAMHNVAGGAANEDPDAKRKRMLAGALSAPFGSMWIARDIAPVLINGAMGVHGAEFKASPMEDALQTIMDTAKGGEKAPELAAKSASYLTGTPLEVNTLVHNFIDWQKGNGELTWKDFLTHRSKR